MLTVHAMRLEIGEGEKDLVGAGGGIWCGESSSPFLLLEDAGTPCLPGR